MKLTRDLIQTYNVKGPRYTSYPTAPNWKPDFDVSIYESKLESFADITTAKPSLSLYVHVPFCESRCYFCACSVLIRKTFPQDFQNQYIDAVVVEAQLVAKKLGNKAEVRQFHIGGGTPSYLSVESIEKLMTGLNELFDIKTEGEIAIEIDPRFIDGQKLDALKKFGFNRLSFGIQDFSESVQDAINRHHSFESVQQLFKDVYSRGFKEVNVDLIYGLPNQTSKSFEKTIHQVIKLRPSRIALYSFAHIPSIVSHQRLIQDHALPSADLKLDLFLQAQKALIDGGYMAIAMDHFALPEDPLAVAFKENKLYRNFMGYTTKPADEYIGLGYSSIGFISGTFIQNVKNLEAYFKSLKEKTLPVVRGLELSEDDKVRHKVIYDLMCLFSVDLTEFRQAFNTEFNAYFSKEWEAIEALEKQGLISISDTKIDVTELGKMFVRNISMVFDAYLNPSTQQQTTFSKTI